MTQFLSNLITASIHGSIVILAVLLLRLVLRRTPKKFICLLWLLAGIRLLMPFEIRSELSLQPDFMLPDWQLPVPVLWVWGGVALCFGIYSLVSYGKLKGKVREAVRIRGGWESDRIDTAFILGFIKPRIYIPMGMNAQSRKHILDHERTHLDKGDHWIKMIGFLALALHWFNPLVWAAYLLLCRDIEMACDERVVQFMELEERKSYSAALIACSSRRMGLSSPVAFGEVNVRQRILSILNYKKPGFWISSLGVLAFFFVAVCLLTSPGNIPVVEPLTPEQQAQREQLEICHADLEAIFAREEFCLDINATNTRGNTRWFLRLYRQGDNTMWTYNPSGRGEITDGRMELDGKHYAWQSGRWLETDTSDTRFDEWVALFLWDPAQAEYVGEELYQDGHGYLFTTQWAGEDQTLHTATHTYAYSPGGQLRSIVIDSPNQDSADRVYLILDSGIGIEIPADAFAQAEAAIGEGWITGEELAEQAEFADWGIYFRVDDDRLSGRGSDVSFSQDEYGFGTVSTTDRYWMERYEEGVWVTVPTVTTPQWTEQGIGVAKGTSTYGYLDWSPLYGELPPGQYRMGKVFRCYDGQTNTSRDHTFYSEFEIIATVDADSPEAKAAVERCYAELEELKNRESLHWISVSGSDSEMEYWVNGEDYVEIIRWTMEDPGYTPRTDINVRYQGVRYATARQDPEVLTSDVLGVGVASLAAGNGGWGSSLREDWNISFFERSNHIITFPPGVGVISEEMVRFQTNWMIAGGMECDAWLTYGFDENGDLNYLEYKTNLDEREYTAYIQICGDTPEEIDAVIRPYTEDPVVRTFSWEEAEAKYTSGEFEIRQTGFRNTQVSPVSDPVEAARRALQEYPNLGEYLSLEVARDEAAGMWRVTVEAYVDYQSTYCYRDVYLADNGVTCLTVYEGPIGWDETRK